MAQRQCEAVRQKDSTGASGDHASLLAHHIVLVSSATCRAGVCSEELIEAVHDANGDRHPYGRTSQSQYEGRAKGDDCKNSGF